MHILIAPNAFKNSLTAEEAAEAMLAGLKQSGLHFTHENFPVADGGNGTASLIVKRHRGRLMAAEVHDPLGRKIRAGFGLIENGKTAVIEMADASGLQFLSAAELNPLVASSAGTGEMISQSLDAGVNKIILGMGGSATVDGGAGILRALGIRFLNAEGVVIPDKPEMMTSLSSIDLSGLDSRIGNCELMILCDVDNPLLGDQGAAAVFGPQKGASAEGVRKLEAGLSRFRETVLRQMDKDMGAMKYGGTAGGASAGLNALLNAKLVNGIDYFLEMNGFDEALEKSSLVITGEGSLDEQTLQGKAPFGVASRAKKKGIPVIALAGKVPLKQNKALDKYFDVLLAIGNAPAELQTAIQVTPDNLIRTAAAIGHLLALVIKDDG
ncbi:MAG: glycerate kinase [Bacteroidota bacterium]|nr:glycerate kinase [Bacteroidota bacterium]